MLKRIMIALLISFSASCLYAGTQPVLDRAADIDTDTSGFNKNLSTADTDVQKALADVFKIISYIQGDTLRIMQANNSVRILIDEKNMENVLALLPKNKIISKETNLAEINIYIHPLMQKTPGILAILANELAINGINIVEVMTCPPEMLFIFKKEEFQKASDVINQLCQPKK